MQCSGTAFKAQYFWIEKGDTALFIEFEKGKTIGLVADKKKRTAGNSWQSDFIIDKEYLPQLKQQKIIYIRLYDRRGQVTYELDDTKQNFIKNALNLIEKINQCKLRTINDKAS